MSARVPSSVVLSRSKANLIALCGYTAVSFAYFGWRLVPHPGRLSRRGRTRPADLHLVVCLVGPRVRDGHEPVRDTRALRPERNQRGLDRIDPGARDSRLADHAAVRAGDRLQHRRRAPAGTRRVDRVSPLSASHRLALGLGCRRISLRILCIRPQPAAHGPSARHRGVSRPARRSCPDQVLGSRPDGAWPRLAPWAHPRLPVLDLDRARLDHDTRPGARARALVLARPRPPPPPRLVPGPDRGELRARGAPCGPASRVRTARLRLGIARPGAQLRRALELRGPDAADRDRRLDLHLRVRPVHSGRRRLLPRAPDADHRRCVCRSEAAHRPAAGSSSSRSPSQL